MKLGPLPPDQLAVLARLRELCLALPEAVEEEKWGHPNWTVAKKIFAAYGFYQGRPSLGTKQTHPDQALLCEDPRFFRSPYVGQHGWVSMWTDGEVDWGMAEELILRSFRLVAPAKVAARLGAAGAKPKAKAKAKPSPKPTAKKVTKGAGKPKAKAKPKARPKAKPKPRSKA